MEPPRQRGRDGFQRVEQCPRDKGFEDRGQSQKIARRGVGERRQGPEEIGGKYGCDKRPWCERRRKLWRWLCASWGWPGGWHKLRRRRRASGVALATYKSGENSDKSAERDWDPGRRRRQRPKIQ